MYWNLGYSVVLNRREGQVTEPGFRKVAPKAFDAAIKAFCHSDEHDFLESRFYNRHGQVIAKVVRCLDEDEELVPEADLLVADPMPVKAGE